VLTVVVPVLTVVVPVLPAVVYIPVVPGPTVRVMSGVVSESIVAAPPHPTKTVKHINRAADTDTSKYTIVAARIAPRLRADGLSA
jgi:hypothetical protein